MNTMIEPQNVIHWFEELSQIPRCSGNEKALSDFLVEFANQRNLAVYQDKALNVIIKKPGTEGYESSETVILQGHMDMVCEKSEQSTHDFDSDPIEWVIEDGRIRANETTLGADNGIAVAYALAVLDSDEIAHPPLEVLVTTEEETGMFGAQWLEADQLSGKKLLNIDTEEEGVFIVSCAGGVNTIVTFGQEREPYPASGIEISVSGLLGGHSGLEINKQRANAIKILGRLLNRAREASDMRIIHLEGGSKHNAIAKNARAVIAVDDAEAVFECLNEFSDLLRSEVAVEDPGLTIEIINFDTDQDPLIETLSDQLIDFILTMPNGVQSVSKSIANLVQTSLNMGVLEETEDKFTFITSVRSSVKSSIDETVDKIRLLAKRCHGEFVKSNEYPAWEYNEKSELREKAIQVYREMTGTEAKVDAIHAGLECGLLGKHLPDCDMISFGPDIRDAHTPTESLGIESMERIWAFLKEYLKALK